MKFDFESTIFDADFQSRLFDNSVRHGTQSIFATGIITRKSMCEGVLVLRQTDINGCSKTRNAQLLGARVQD